MDPKGQLFFFAVAFVCFAVSAFWNMEKTERRTVRSVNLVSLGLAFFDLVFAYNAYKAI
jgi:hypothetical protein